MIQTKENRKFNKKILIYTIVPIMFILAIILNIIFSPKQNSNKEHGTGTEVTYVEYNVGESFEFDGLKFNIYEWETKKYLPNNAKANDGYMWIILNARIYNPNNSTAHLKEGILFPSHKYSSDLVYKDSYKYNDSFFDRSEWILSHEEIMPLGTLDGIYSFMVPEEVAKEGALYWTLTYNKVDKQDVIVKVNIRE